MAMRDTLDSRAEVIVVGGGLAGLSAAALAAAEGRSVIVVEQSGHLGGRAATHQREHIHWNLGPHALYCHGHAFRLFTKLGIPFTGRIPNPGHGQLIVRDKPYPIPAGVGSLLGSVLLTVREKWRLARFLMKLSGLETRHLDCVPLQDWLDRTAGTGNLSLFLRALFRVSTYCDEPERMSAGTAIAQLRLALAGNVWYLDGGWQTLVDGLHDHAVRLGADFRTGARVQSVSSGPDGVLVQLATGEELIGRAAIVAVEPKKAVDLLDMPPDSSLARWVHGRIPVRAACLDLALTRLPRPDHRFALGLDRSFYFSVHSAAARLAPDGVAVVHVMKYLGNDTATSSQDIECELESFLDQLQPGWKEYVLARRFLPAMTVAHSLPRAQENGLQGRPPVAVSERPNIYLAGDWVGAEGMLVDASVASAAESARCVVAALARNQTIERSAVHVER